MRTFAEELILITAFALGVSAIAAPPPSKLTPSEISAMAAAKLAAQKPSEHISGEKEQQKVVAARNALAGELVARGYSADEAARQASIGLSSLDEVLNPCDFSREDQKEIPKRAEYKSELNVEDEKVMCEQGAETLDKLMSSQKELVEQLKVSSNEKGENPASTDDKANPKDAGTGNTASVPDKAAEGGGVNAGNPGAGNLNSAPGINAGAGGIVGGAGTILPRPTAPQLGPLMGTAAKGNSSMGGYDGHKGARGSHPSEPSENLPHPNQNMEIVRQALEQKVLQREISPAVADSLLNKLAPALQREPDIASALEKANWDRPAGRGEAKPVALAQKSEPTPKPEPLKKAETETAAPAKPKASQTEGELAVGAAKEADSVWVLNGAANAAGLTDLKKGQLGDSLASSIANAIAKKGAPLPSEDEFESAGGDSTPAVSSSSALLSGGLFENSPGTAEANLERKKPSVQALLGSTAFRNLIDRASRAIYGDTRQPASAQTGAFDHFQEAESMALASLGRGGALTLHPSMDVWTPVIFFLTPFTLSLVGFALWSWRKRRRAA